MGLSGHSKGLSSVLNETWRERWGDWKGDLMMGDVAPGVVILLVCFERLALLFDFES